MKNYYTCDNGCGRLFASADELSTIRVHFNREVERVGGQKELQWVGQVKAVCETCLKNLTGGRYAKS